MQQHLAENMQKYMVPFKKSHMTHFLHVVLHMKQKLDQYLSVQ